MASSGLYQAWLLDGLGGGREVDWDDVAAYAEEDGLMWVDLDFSATNARDWLRGLASIPEVA